MKLIEVEIINEDPLTISFKTTDGQYIKVIDRKYLLEKEGKYYLEVLDHPTNETSQVTVEENEVIKVKKRRPYPKNGRFRMKDFL